MDQSGKSFIQKYVFIIEKNEMPVNKDNKPHMCATHKHIYITSNVAMAKHMENAHNRDIVVPFCC